MSNLENIMDDEVYGADQEDQFLDEDEDINLGDEGPADGSSSSSEAQMMDENDDDADLDEGDEEDDEFLLGMQQSDATQGYFSHNGMLIFQHNLTIWVINFNFFGRFMTESVYCVAINTTNSKTMALSGSGDNTATLWDFTTGEVLFQLKGKV
jgi:WD40 repeat protein